MSHKIPEPETGPASKSRPDLQQLIERRLGRRALIGGGIGLATTGALASLIASCSQEEKPATEPLPSLVNPQARMLAPRASLLGFAGVAAVLDQTFDAVRVAPGYRVQPFFSWGDAVIAGAPAWQADGSNDASDQELQAGQSHDGMVYFPSPLDPQRGLLAINHEDVEPETLHPSGPSMDKAGRRPLAEVKKEMAAMGVSIIEIKKNGGGQWERVLDSLYNRRLTGDTPMEICGPAAAHPLMRTEADPEGRLARGTLNNCASGQTPWGTYLTCEENFYQYFGNRNEADLQARREHSRVGVPLVSKYGWESAVGRFDASPQKDRPHRGFVNEPNRFGWVVEIDPFKPHALPKKRTALGRFAHENVATAVDAAGRMAFYMGDDARGEYIYKFIPKSSLGAKGSTSPGDLLDEGTLYVAVFNEDGSGRWIDLVHGRHGLTALNRFKDQGEVLINTRAAADHVGATPMDRPEWVAIDPESKDVYVTLTNNSKRGMEEGRNELNAANPRPNNIFGHIIKMIENNAEPTALEFRWEFFVLAGDASMPDTNLQGTIKGDAFGSPDGLMFDASGRLWIQTDFDDATPEYQKSIGLNQLLAADPRSREIRRFLVGPKGCEVTGIAFSPDQRAMWVNIQHPSLSYPASDGQTRARSTTVLITKDDQGEIGS